MKKKALIITAVAGFIRGFLVSDIQILQEMGYEVHCAADAENVGADGIEAFFDELNIVFHQIGFNSKKPFSKETFQAYRQVRRLLAKERFAVIHCHTPIAGCITRFAANKYRRRGTRVIYTSHGFYFHDRAPKKDWLIYYPLELLASTWCDAIVTINQEDYHRAQKMWTKKAYHINGVGLNLKKYKDVVIDREAYRRSIGVEPEDIVVLAAGELTERKNHQVIIRALGKLRDPRLVFVLCGRAMQGKGTYDRLVALAEEEKVRFLPLGFRSDMPAIYRCAEMCVLPSKREGLGMVSLQAMIAGVPLVTPNVHGIKDYMRQGKTGYLCDPDDVEGFAEGIRKLCDPQVRASMRENCIKMAEQFSQEVSSGQMRAIYQELLG